MQPEEEEDPLGWADLGRSWANVKKNQRRVGAGRKDDWAKIKNGMQHYFSNFLNKDLSSKVNDSNVFKPNLN
jgi:hypothetical protein